MTNLPRLAVPVSILLFTISGSAAGTSSRAVLRASVFQRHGMQALEAGNTKKAHRYLNEAVDILPFFPEAHLGLGHIAMQELRFEDALSEYRLARDGYREIGESRVELEGLRYRDAQNEMSDLRDQILSIERSTVVTRMSSPRFDHAISMMRDRMRRLEMVEPPTGTMIGSDPPGQIHFFLGNALFRLNRVEEALDAWETCARQSPDFAVVHNNLAVVYLKLGRREDARQSLARAETLGFSVNPDFKASLGLTPMALPAKVSSGRR
jgi:tetratricopeptide (TPR) repeat protein